MPNCLFKVRDRNNATDGDVLIAWALLEAAEAGF
ncbi:MAG: glycosyl hydrolase family 8, partial [Pseudomonadota bacterium]